MDIAQKTFTLAEWLTLTGFAQCLLILTYMGFRLGANQILQAALPLTYFFSLAAGFALQFALRLEDLPAHFGLWLWLAWAMGPPLSFLLILQIANAGQMPRIRNFSVLALVPLALGATLLASKEAEFCEKTLVGCDRFYDWLYLSGMAAGAVSLLGLWLHKGIFEKLRHGKSGRERYWLVILLIVMNLFLLVIHFLRFSPWLDALETDMLRSALGLAFAYLASTALFRIYPPPVQLSKARKPEIDDLDDAEKALARRIYDLMTLDKLYHEPAFSRADLARELQVPENTVSRIINAAFGKSFPQLLNEYRVEDAKRMLDTSDAQIKIVAMEVGFNSLASFNRVFKDVTGIAPSSWRNEKPRE